MMYPTITRESPKIAILRVLGATLLALVGLLGVQSSASAQSVCAAHGANLCETVVTERLNQLDIDIADIRSIYYVRRIRTGRENDRVIGIDAWVNFHSCKGSLVINMSRHGHVRQVYTRGECEVPGISNY